MRMRRRRWWRLLRLADAGQLEVAAVAAAARTALGALAEVQTHALHVRAVRRRAHRPAAHVAPHERNGNLLVRPSVTRRRRTCGSTRTTCRRELRTDAHATMETYYYASTSQYYELQQTHNGNLLLRPSHVAPHERTAAATSWTIAAHRRNNR